MKVSSIILPSLKSVKSVWDMPQIETDTDALRVLSNQGDINGYVKEHGDHDVYLVDNVYHVPALCVARGKYMKWKKEQCAIHGCE